MELRGECGSSGVQSQPFGRQQQREQQQRIQQNTTEPIVEAVEAAAAATAQVKSAEMKEIVGDTALGGTAVQAAHEATEDADWMEVMAAVGMAEKAANDRAIAELCEQRTFCVSSWEQRGQQTQQKSQQ